MTKKEDEAEGCAYCCLLLLGIFIIWLAIIYWYITIPILIIVLLIVYYTKHEPKPKPKIVYRDRVVYKEKEEKEVKMGFCPYCETYMGGAFVCEVCGYNRFGRDDF